MYNETTVLGIIKARLNRLASDTSLDEYLRKRIQATDEQLSQIGIHLVNGNPADEVLLADHVVWGYQNRDSNTGMPEWLRMARRERWLKERSNDSG